MALRRLSYSLIGILGIFPAAYGQVFECGFIQEKNEYGKPNEVTCSGDPELEFSTKNKLHPRNQHCNQLRVHAYDDLTNMIVNLERKTAEWSPESGNIDNIRSKKQWPRKKLHIAGHGIQLRSINIDEETGSVFEPPKQATVHFLILDDGNDETHFLYIPEDSYKSILISPSMQEQLIPGTTKSSLTLRFGTCKKIDKKY